MTNDAPRAPAVRLRDVSLRYGKTRALEGVTLDIPARLMIGLIGPDGVGKSSLLSLIAGAHAVQTGKVEVLGGDISEALQRQLVGPRIAYMPQGLGKNLLTDPVGVRESRFLWPLVRSRPDRTRATHR